MALAFLVCTLIAIVVNAVPNRMLIGYKFRHQLMDLLPNLITAGIECGAVLLVGMLHINDAVLLILQIVTGVAVYLGVSIIIKNSSLFYILNFVKSQVRRKHEKNN